MHSQNARQNCLHSASRDLLCALWPQMASVELWSEIMFDTQMAVGRETQPLAEANEHIGLLWVLFMVGAHVGVLACWGGGQGRRGKHV